MELGPVTLLFGSNSAGKSTIFHAFLYAYEVLVNRNYNADRTTLGGGGVDLGGFQKFVHNHDLSRKVGLQIHLDLSSAQLDQEWRISEFFVGEKDNRADVSEIGTDVWDAKIGFQIAWDASKKTPGPYVSNYSVELDGTWLLRIDRTEDREQIFSEVNYRHPLFGWPTAVSPRDRSSTGILDHLHPQFQTVIDSWFWSEEAEEVSQEEFQSALDLTREHSSGIEITGLEPTSFLIGEIPESVDISDYRKTYLVDADGMTYYFYRFDHEAGKAVLEFAKVSPSDSWNEEDEMKLWADRVENGRLDVFKPTIVLEQEDALPRFDRPIQFLISPRDDLFGPVESNQGDLIRDILSRLTLGPTKLLAQELERFRHIGPLREVPQRGFQNTLSPDPARWSAGLAAWDMLSVSEDEFVGDVSDWLSGDQKLGTGYRLERKRYKELEPDGYIMRILKQENPLDDLPIALEGIAGLEEKNRLVFVDDKTGVEVEPLDIAVGITQVLPVIVSAVDSHDGVTLIEQPELHNHPRVEVGLGDLFIETIEEGHDHCRFLLETHGEHLVLRMLRRINETTDGELPEGVKGLVPDHIAIYFIQRIEGGVEAKRLRVDETGEFIDKWPGGFFRERAEELF